MRVGFDLLFLIPRETGGRETYARELIRALLETDSDLRPIAFVNREAEAELAGTYGSRMEVVGLPVSARRPSSWASGELGLLPRVAGRAGIEVLHSLANFGPATGRFRRVLTVHDLQYRAVPELLTPVRRAGTGALMRLAARRAHRIIAVSAFTAGEAMRELSLSEHQIDVVPNGVGSPVEAPIPETELRERHMLGERDVVLSVSTALPHKNHERLIEAVALIPADRRPVLVLVGSGTDGARLHERVQRAGLERDTRLLGFQAPEALDGLYRLAGCAAVPSLYEGFGFPVLEAMLRDTPVACSDIPAFKEIAGNAALLFPPRRADQIATALERLLTDHALADRLREAGRRRADRFSWRRAAEATVASYRRALEPPARLGS